MNKFRMLGFIDYNGGIEVHSSLFERGSPRPATDKKVISRCLCDRRGLDDRRSTVLTPSTR